MRTTIQDVEVGKRINSARNGNGMITAKTKKTITVIFENGKTVKNSYKNNDDYFYGSDF
jgi:hypothetical protein